MESGTYSSDKVIYIHTCIHSYIHVTFYPQRVSPFILHVWRTLTTIGCQVWRTWPIALFHRALQSSSNPTTFWCCIPVAGRDVGCWLRAQMFTSGKRNGPLSFWAWFLNIHPNGEILLYIYLYIYIYIYIHIFVGLTSPQMVKSVKFRAVATVLAWVCQGFV